MQCFILKNIFNFCPENSLFGYFLASTLKILLSYLKSAPSNFSKRKVLRKNKDSEISKTIVIFEINPLKLARLQKFVQKQKNPLNLGPKKPFLDAYRLQNWVFLNEIFYAKQIKFWPKATCKGILGL